MDIRPPNNLASQILYIAEGKPPILCSLFNKAENSAYSPADLDPDPEVRDYTVRMAQLLKTALTNFCHSDFAILRFCTNIDGFNVDILKAAVVNELGFTRMFFRGDVDLTAAQYTDITKAVDALACGSYAPCLLGKEEDEVGYTPSPVLLLPEGRPDSSDVSSLVWNLRAD